MKWKNIWIIQFVSDELSNILDTEVALRSLKKKKKGVFQGVFEFRFTPDKEKFSKCKLCEEKDKQQRIIKMKDGNTTGITRHFKTYHEVEYEKAFSGSVFQPLKEVII